MSVDGMRHRHSALNYQSPIDFERAASYQLNRGQLKVQLEFTIGVKYEALNASSDSLSGGLAR
jgi:hypothetical protein